MQRIELRGLRPLTPASLVIGSRGSQLALWQANWVKAALVAANPALAVTIKTIKTTGDKIQDVPLAKVGGKGLFIKEIESALLDGQIDLAVHSLKDMPADLPEGLCIGAITRREDPRDVLVARGHLTLEQMAPGARIGTSSLRRQAQLLHTRPDLTIIPLRGNLDTRLKKLHRENLDAIVLAAAGVHRLEMHHHISAYLPPAVMLPAAGQGALCLEHRRNDPAIEAVAAPLEHSPSRIAVTGERALLHRLEGGCQVPIAAFGQVQDGSLRLEAMVAGVNGRRLVRDVLEGPVEAATQLGLDLAERLLDKGAAEILTTLQTGATQP